MLKLTVIRASGHVPLGFTPTGMINAGYVGRDLSATQAHIEELQREGVPPPPSIPMLYPILRHNITTDNHIEVVGDKTSGEAEFVLLLAGDSVYVGVGSDHTDRQLETNSILLSKQVCPNVMSKQLWDYQDVRNHWDDLLLESWTRPGPREDEVLYQQAPLGVILPAEEIIALVKSRVSDGDVDGLVIFSGTVPTVTGRAIYGSHFRCSLTDPIPGRTLTCEYKVVKLDYLKQ